MSLDDQLEDQLNVHEVRDLAWVFESPGLLSQDRFARFIETDADFHALLRPHLQSIFALDRSPQPLIDFLASLQTHGRLGRYFENLLRFFLLELLKVERVISNLQIQEQGITRGELDLVFQHLAWPRPRHWEASVKFYLCVTTDEAKARDPRYFMGTLVEDRFDRKLDKLLHRQLTLPQREAAKLKLAEQGISDPESRALLKGMLFYPSHVDWRKHPHPPEVSPHHHRGWWTTSQVSCLPQSQSMSLYMELPPGRWLSGFKGPVMPTLLMTRAELEERVHSYFSGPETPRAVFREMMVVEVELIPAPTGFAESSALVWIREISRGHILHGRWPEIANASAQLSGKIP